MADSGASRFPGVTRLEVFKALGDNTRYAIYLELARSSVPLTTSEIAETLDLHPNTVRPHLERMREAGLLAVETEATGAVGRPQHRYSLSPDAPSLGLEAPAFPVLARGLLSAAISGGLDPEDAVEAGRQQGRADAARGSGSTVERVIDRLDELGFDPAVVDDGEGRVTVAFTRCPYRELADEHPELVCGLHRGMVEGLTGDRGHRVDGFCSIASRTPCQVDLVEV